MNNVAWAVSDQGKYAEAEKMHRETLVLKEKVLRRKYPDTLMSVYSLAYLCNTRTSMTMLHSFMGGPGRAIRTYLS